jgi:hypothetical protein
MIELSVSIDVKNKEDLDIIIASIKTLNIEKPVFIVTANDHFHVWYETNEYTERIEDALSHKLSYIATETLYIGKPDIRAIITTIQSPMSADSWGRQFNSDSISRTIYFIREEEKEDIQTPKQKFSVLFDTLEREYEMYVTDVSLKQGKKRGFIVTKTPFIEGKLPDLLYEKLFDNGNQAFWQGFYKMVPNIQDEFKEIKRTNKGKRKKDL